jgi:hypothetical protein
VRQGSLLRAAATSTSSTVVLNLDPIITNHRCPLCLLQHLGRRHGQSGAMP